MRTHTERQHKNCRFFSSKPRDSSSRQFFPVRRLRLHPLFLLLGVWYACKGELFLFFTGTLVALQHEYAHALASAKLGYRLHAIVLMPYGAILDGDLRSISLKDEIFVALAGPLCNLCTALFFLALWWLTPTMYAFTDVAFYNSLSIALLNLLPAYPLDGGRILRCLLIKRYLTTLCEERLAERTADRVCKRIALSISLLFLLGFILFLLSGSFRPTLLTFGIFLAFGCKGNADKSAVYQKFDFAVTDALRRGIEVRRVAILHTCAVKDALRFLTRGAYLVLEVYDEQEQRLFVLTQNQLSLLFSAADSPYETIGDLYRKKRTFMPKNRKKNGK